MNSITDEHDEPLTASLARSTAILAATLTGLGVIFWLAANWDTLGRIGQFALLQVATLACGLAALWRPGWRAPLTLLLFLLTGGLLANVGQTYQTGADPWQLFALWAVLGLPMAWSARHDALWAAWAVVLMTALSLWVTASTHRWWHVRDQDAATHLFAWALSLLTVGGLSAPARPWTGAGLWSLRLTLTLTVIAITCTAVSNLLASDGSWLYALALLALGAGAALLSRSDHFDLYGLSGFALGLNVCLVSGLGRLLLDGARGDMLLAWLLMGLMAAGLLGGTVKVVMQLARQHGGAA